jgi:transposase-like protein
MKGRREIREKVIAEYLSGDLGYRELELRYGIGKSTLQRWVKAAELERPERRKDITRKVEVPKQAGTKDPDELSESEAAAEIRRLRRELYKTQLHTELLNAMIDIARDELGIDIRKKHGPKR